MPKELVSQWFEDQIFRIATKGKSFIDPNNCKIPFSIKIITPTKPDVSILKNELLGDALSQIWGLIRPKKNEDSGYLYKVAVSYPGKIRPETFAPKYASDIEQAIRRGKIKRDRAGRLRGPGGRFISKFARKNKAGRWYDSRSGKFLKGIK